MVTPQFVWGSGVYKVRYILIYTTYGWVEEIAHQDLFAILYGIDMSTEKFLKIKHAVMMIWLWLYSVDLSRIIDSLTDIRSRCHCTVVITRPSTASALNIPSLFTDPKQTSPMHSQCMTVYDTRICHQREQFFIITFRVGCMLKTLMDNSHWNAKEGKLKINPMLLATMYSRHDTLGCGIESLDWLIHYLFWLVVCRHQCQSPDECRTGCVCRVQRHPTTNSKIIQAAG